MLCLCQIQNIRGKPVCVKVLNASLKTSQVLFSLVKGSLKCDKLSETPLSIQSHRQLLLPWGWAIEIVCLWLSEKCTLPEHTRLRADLGVFMCAVTQQLAPWGRGRVVVRLLCETCPLPPQRWDNTSFIPHQRLVLFLWRESVWSLQSKVASEEACGAQHIIPGSLCFWDVHSFCGDVKRDRHKNLNVVSRRDTSVLLLFFLSSWIIISYSSH